MTDMRCDKFTRPTFSEYLAAKLEAIAGRRNMTEVAREIGYQSPNIVEMFKRGEARVPLDKIVVLARAVDADPAFMGHLWLADVAGHDSAVWQPFVTEREFAIVEVIRDASRHTDPAIDDGQKHQIRAMFSSNAGGATTVSSDGSTHPDAM